MSKQEEIKQLLNDHAKFTERMESTNSYNLADSSVTRLQSIDERIALLVPGLLEENERLQKELEKNRENMGHCKSSLRAAKQLSKEIDHTGAPKDMQTFRVFAKNMKIHMALVDWDLINSLAVGQEGEGNQDEQGASS